MKLRMTECLNILDKNIPDHRIVLDSFKNTVPFVIADSGADNTVVTYSKTERATLDVEIDNGSKRCLAPPFPVTSYEFESPKTNIILHCVELSPDKFIFTWVDGGFSDVCTAESDPDAYALYRQSLYLHMCFMDSKKHGVVNQKRAYKFNKGKGDKRIFKQSKFVYINPSKSEQRERIDGKKIKYSNGFYVSAHWRKIHNQDSLGLNREGERCVKGLTWVGHYYKGEDPIIKIRKVK